MKTITTIATVTTDGKITVQLPPDIIAGEHEVVVMINEKPMTKEKREGADAQSAASQRVANLSQTSPLKFSAYAVGLVSENFSFRREDLYAND